LKSIRRNNQVKQKIDGEALSKKTKFWLFFMLGILIYTPFFIFSIMVHLPLASLLFFGGFLIYCYGLHRAVFKKVEPKYPLVPPEGRMTDIYFPRSRIPRPIYEDLRRYPESFKRKKMERWEKRGRVKKKG